MKKIHKIKIFSKQNKFVKHTDRQEKLEIEKDEVDEKLQAMVAEEVESGEKGKKLEETNARRRASVVKLEERDVRGDGLQSIIAYIIYIG